MVVEIEIEVRLTQVSLAGLHSCNIVAAADDEDEVARLLFGLDTDMSVAGTEAVPAAEM